MSYWAKERIRKLNYKAQNGVRRHSIMGNMKELSGYGRENEKFKPCLTIKGEIEDRDMAVSSRYMIDFFQAFLGSLI